MTPPVCPTVDLVDPRSLNCRLSLLKLSGQRATVGSSAIWIKCFDHSGRFHCTFSLHDVFLQIRRALLAIGEVEREAGEERSRHDIAESHRKLIPEEPTSDRYG